jgi:DNA ligase 1
VVLVVGYCPTVGALDVPCIVDACRWVLLRLVVHCEGDVGMTNSPPKPMLANKEWAWDDIKYPVYVQPKYDGVRALVKDGVVYGRSGDPIKNQLVQTMFGWLEGCDGELVAAGKMRDKNCCRLTTSIVNSPTKDEDCDFIVYDVWDSPEEDFYTRFDKKMSYLFATLAPEDGGSEPNVSRPALVVNQQELEERHKEHLSQGYEGTIIRKPLALYKHGRSGKKDMALLALKDFTDTEGTVVGSTELMHNENAKEQNAFGRTKRSSAKAGKVASGMLGTLIVESPKWKKQFEIGSGFTESERKAMWLTRELLIGKIVKFKYFDHGGKDKPRHPIFLSWREKGDM